MIHVIGYDVNGNIVSTVRRRSDAIVPDPADGITYMMVDTPGLIDLATTWVKNEELATRTGPPTNYYYWDADTETWQIDESRIVEHLREKRTEKLRACDWTQLGDAPLTGQEKAEWIVYRQSLRALPDQATGIDHIDDIPWPTEPS